jgi:hypothetical protein
LALGEVTSCEVRLCGVPSTICILSENGSFQNNSVCYVLLPIDKTAMENYQMLKGFFREKIINTNQHLVGFPRSEVDG